jgi:YjbE family integral membrane protein
MLETLIAEIPQLLTQAWWKTNWIPFVNIIMIDLVLAGDNAIIVGLAAARVEPSLRARVIFWGIAAAVILRILFALITTQLLAIIGLTFAGGILLLFVCWKMYQQINMPHGESVNEDGTVSDGAAVAAPLTFGAAVFQIMLADVTMSLDNVLAVAGAAKGSPMVLVLGLLIAIIMMAVASHAIARLLVKRPWIAYVGLAVITWVAVEMIYKGSKEILCKGYQTGCVEKAMLFLPGLS